MNDQFKPELKIGGRYSAGPTVEMRNAYGGVDVRINTGDVSIELALSPEDADKLGRILILYAGIESPVLTLIEAEPKEPAK